MTDSSLLIPDWTLPAGVQAFVTTRTGGFSKGVWQEFNLGLHVGDEAVAVLQNRVLLQEKLQQHTGLPVVSLQWLQQVHGNGVHIVDQSGVKALPPQADAIYTQEIGIVCGVLTADCLPVLFCNDDGSEIAVAHAGWRGLANGVLEKTLAVFKSAPDQIRVWLGPAIGPCHFEVGSEVKAQFLELTQSAWQQQIAAAFKPTDKPGKYLADLYQLARVRLAASGVDSISGVPCCTVCDSNQWYSYRHAPVTGRFATLILRVN